MLQVKPRRAPLLGHLGGPIALGYFGGLEVAACLQLHEVAAEVRRIEDGQAR